MSLAVFTLSVLPFTLAEMRIQFLIREEYDVMDVLLYDPENKPVAMQFKRLWVPVLLYGRVMTILDPLINPIIIIWRTQVLKDSAKERFAALSHRVGSFVRKSTTKDPGRQLSGSGTLTTGVDGTAVEEEDRV